MTSNVWGPESLADVRKAFAEVSADRPVALTIQHGTDVLLQLHAGQRFDGRPFTGQTPVLLYSAIKAVVGLTATVLAARGDLDPTRPIASVWPAFGKHDKGDVTIEQALAHAAGVPGWPEPMSLDGLRDLATNTANLTDQPAWWPAGEIGEHAYTYGHLISGIVAAAVGRPLHQIWAEDYAPALGIDLTFTPHPDAEPMVDPDGMFLSAMRTRQEEEPRLWSPVDLCDPSVINRLTADDPAPPIAPAVLGWGGADALAALYAFWSGGTGHLPGKPAVWERSLSMVAGGTDHVMGDQRSWGYGICVDDEIAGMGGIGGCSGWFDRISGLSCGLTTPILGSMEHLEPLEAAIDGLR